MQTEMPIVIMPSQPNTVPVSSAGKVPLGIAGAGVVLIVVAAVVFSRRRTRRMDPRELAFRTIVRKLGYNRQQIKALRQTAMKSAMTSPVGLAMSPSLSAQIIQSDRQPQ